MTARDQHVVGQRREGAGSGEQKGGGRDMGCRALACTHELGYMCANACRACRGNIRSRKVPLN